MHAEKKFLQLGLTLTAIFVVVTSKKIYNENDIPELHYLNTSVDPCDNFYEYSCGNFGTFYPRPDTLNIFDQFEILEDELIKLGQEILSTPKSSDDSIAVQKAKAAYNACVNPQLLLSTFNPEMLTIQEFGGLPLIASPNETVEFSWNEIGDLVGKYGVPLIFSYTVGQLSRNESVIQLSPDSLLNPSLFRPKITKNYEDVLEQDFQEKVHSRAKRDSKAPFDIFLKTLAKILLRNANQTKSDEEIQMELNEVATFMRQLYSGGIVDQDYLPLTSQPTVGQLQEWTDLNFGTKIDLNWIDYLNKVFQISNVKITNDVKFYQVNTKSLFGILNLVQKTDPKTVKNFALLRVFLFQAPDSNFAVRKAFDDYYQAKGYQLYSRPEYCARKILDVVDTASLSYAVTHAYEKYYYNINKLSKAAEMIQNIQSSFQDILNESDWMDSESQKAALEKVQNTLVLLGYPNFVFNSTTIDKFYENFRICEWDAYGNAKTIRAFKQAYQFSQLEPDRYFWGKSTFDPNAYYNRPNNKIVIPISMLNPVFFYGDNPILDYSRLGSIIGHEITHGFDVNGKNYDQDGFLESWWSNETMARFTEKTKCFVDQYSQYYIPEVDINVNGSYCLNENLADNGGVRESYRAFKKIVELNGLEANGNYTLEQMFFISYATMWCGEESNYALKILAANSYPPKRFRVIGSLSNMKEFSEAFNCPVGSNMNPENKCQLW